MIEALFTEHRHRAIRYARWMVGNENDAEEVVQEAFLRLAKREASDRAPVDALAADAEKRFAGMLFTTVRNLAIDLLRKKSRRRDVSLSSVNEPVADESDGTARQLNARITSLIGELPENWAEALKLKITGDLSYEEIAKVLKCTKAQVRTWIFRARRQLANELTRQGWLDNQI